MPAQPFWLQLESARAGHTRSLQATLDAIAWNDAGLIPVITQRHDDGEVLMLAWMNRAALTETLSSGQVCYWSRSRQRLWRKGETSGHRQRLHSARLDCDGDALLLRVEQTGPACHTGRPACFYNELDGEQLRVVVSRPG
ncbi:MULTISPECIES: phosphoribosyl-AMP cyclohydrolase [Pseudomonas]|jgi:phosphoribosyl-AMP cyclohydrolase|uniref:Phosphoribosyl-AMP cyclohydrolase n=1 Tax=Ectopseudomonas oleovorans TaxID=301 RepID=A0A653B3U1_ECTOL|nr:MULTISPECIES: phosphoribosyl-AMP cyclohydrolase [Pseudomonas]CAE6965465.1 Phosphoribosyl-AMP cyclohydrolase 2 [Pseudomonas oleovorans]